jgi:S1-C subfamily serine protease
MRPSRATHEYKRHGTVSSPAGIDLLTGKVHALAKDATAAASSPGPHDNPLILVIRAVGANGIAADHGLQVGDVILDISGKSVDVRRQIADAREQGKHTLLFRVS